MDSAETIERLQTQLQAKVVELLDAGPDRIRVLSAEIQRLRVGIGLLREVKAGAVDSALYRELSLLTKMLTEDDLERMQRESAEVQSTERTERLTALGISPLSAARIARVLTNVVAHGPAEDPQHPRN